jgi:sporulation protein YlmC with PRC-barrel domain/uncharacterized membrane protein YgcG
LNNLSIGGTNLTEVLAKLDGLSGNITYVKNNMFYQGNATGSFLVDYLATVYTEKNSRAELWVLTRDLLGNSKTVSAATCGVVRRGAYIANATVSVSPGSVYSYWDIPSNQTSGDYSWNCTLTGSTLNLEVPFFVSSITSNFAITSLESASPKYPNENAIIEATFANQNGSVEPDSINLTIWKPNYLTIWYSADKNDFSVRNGVWYWTQMIEASPTTGAYYVNVKAIYDGHEDSRTTQFRIATGGPYKVYLECPTSSNVGSNLICTVILQDEGEAATESTTTIWVDTNNNGVLDLGEPQTSFSKETQPTQNVTETATINVPSTHTTGSFVVRASTEYLNSGQPNSAASDSVTLQAGGGGGSSTGGSGSSGGGGGITGGVVDGVVCSPPYIRYGKECCLDGNRNSVCDKDENSVVNEESENKTLGDETTKIIPGNTNYVVMSSLIILILLILLIIVILNRRKDEEQINSLSENIKEVRSGHLDNVKLINGDKYIEIKPRASNTFADISLKNHKDGIFTKLIGSLSFLWTKKYASNSIFSLIGKKVYSENRHYVGKISDVVLGVNRIESLKIKIDKKYKFKAKGMILNYRHVKSVSEIVIIDDRIHVQL